MAGWPVTLGQGFRYDPVNPFTEAVSQKLNVYIIFSDFIIAWNMFVEPVPYRTYLVLVTYYLAQWLLYIRSTSFRVGPEMRLMRF